MNNKFPNLKFLVFKITFMLVGKVTTKELVFLNVQASFLLFWHSQLTWELKFLTLGRYTCKETFLLSVNEIESEK